MGRKEWNYDAKGLLASETDSVLRSKQAAIKYEYDELDRITKIDYPFSEDTFYTYGKAETAGAGKIVHKTDETGETFYTYGKLGEITEERRTIKRARDFQEPVTASFKYEVDYLGRMQTITYPDGELVKYTYDAGGQLNGVSGEKLGVKYKYVDSILYDEQGQRVYIRYGNGVETRYTYDPARRWLDSIKTVNKDKNLIFQNIKYNFDAVGNVAGYENTASTYATSQSYTYDNLYQLVKAEGTTKLYAGVNPVPEYEGKTLKTNKYCQDFSFDKIGNMLSKTSTTNLEGSSLGGKNDSSLNYALNYEYDPSYAHRLVRAGERHYKYDANGNITAEKDGAFEAEDDFTFKYSYFEDLDVYGVDYGFDLAPPKKDPANLAESSTWNGKENGYRRDYEWNERNLLSRSRDREKNVTYRYGDDGERALKFCLQTNAETLYFNNFYGMQQVAHEPNHEQGLRVSKHIFVGNSRLVTALTHQAGLDTTEQAAKLYYYHADHLQSAQFITDANGEKYEHIEYTPYGELWIEETAPGVDKLPFRFTGKELDEETGLYYYGARYLDPKYSRWLSGDPALGEYIPQAPVNDEAKNHNENLPGMGGVFNTVNLHVYHYAGNNPVKYVDPDGRIVIPVPVPWFVPWSIPYMEPFIGPIDILPPIYVNPKDGFYRFVPDSNDSDIDWNYAPNGPDMSDPNSNPLGSDWEKKPGSEKDKTGQHRQYKNKKTGEEVRWDEDDGHWHRLNPDKSSNKKYPYLDKDGKPVKKRSPDGHIQPNPKPSTNGFDWNNVPMATKNKFILEDKYETTFA